VLELTIRLVFSLAVVVGLLLVLVRVGGRRFRGSADALVRVVHRQPLSRSSAVAVVTVGSRVLVLGTTEQQVSVLAELEPEELDEQPGAELLSLPEVLPEILTEDVPEVLEVPAPPAPRTAGSHRASHRAARAATDSAAGALAGSVLSPQTWRQAYRAATGARPPTRAPSRHAS
jgi:flagellar protein FliO/FliZ